MFSLNYPTTMNNRDLRRSDRAIRSWPNVANARANSSLLTCLHGDAGMAGYRLVIQMPVGQLTAGLGEGAEIGDGFDGGLLGIQRVFRVFAPIVGGGDDVAVGERPLAGGGEKAVDVGFADAVSSDLSEQSKAAAGWIGSLQSAARGVGWRRDCRTPRGAGG